ncbi:MAG: Succinate dehydrogenase/fumarate reductase,flavoprotein subunit, partial [Candidatus Eremiobacteraeota bacterium]|nr:Succinate dehydrogenase/fumarate reductase,flavoprotein subunit [Candidatus Eremiobacteraeota bacterium]
MREEHYDIVIVGASLGGVAAALRASALGANVCLLEASSWAGGQYSGQGLTRGDDNQYVDQGTSGARGVGSTALYRRFREGARAFYSGSFALSAQGKAMKPFDPGAPTQHFATNLRIAPRAAHDVLLAMLAGTHPAVTVRLQTPVHAAELAGNRVTAVRARPFYGVETRYHASFFLDATDLGELLPLANVPHRVGAESTAQTGEPFAPATPQPAWLQPITVPIALELRPTGENHTIPKPDFYDEIVAARKFAPHFTSIFRITQDDSLFNYRQFIAKDNFADPAFPYDVTTINDDQNDYTVRSIPSGNPAQDAQTIAAARARSVAYAYYLQ